MQFYDVSRASLVVQAVHVLGDDAVRPAHALQLGQGVVGPVGLHC